MIHENLYVGSCCKGIVTFDGNGENLEIHPVENHVYSLVDNHNASVSVQLADGNFLNFRNGEITPFEVEHLNRCVKTDYIPNIGLIGLTGRRRLYLNNREISSQVNSFFVHKKLFIIYDFETRIKSDSVR